MLKKFIIVLFSFIKKKIYFNDLKKIKTNTWKSKRVTKKFYKIHNLDDKDIFHRINCQIFLKYIKKNSKILDVGCGTGRLLNILRTVSDNCYGLDASQNMLDQINPKKNLYCGSVFEMPFNDNFFDVVTSMDLMVHFDQTEEIIKEKLRVVKKDGLIIFNIGSSEHYNFSKNIYKKKFNPIYENKVETLKKPYYKTILDDELVEIGRRIGFDLIDTIPYNFFLSNILFTSADNEDYKFDVKFKEYFKSDLFYEFVENFEKKIINKSNPALTFYKIIILKKN